MQYLDISMVYVQRSRALLWYSQFHYLIRINLTTFAIMTRYASSIYCVT